MRPAGCASLGLGLRFRAGLRRLPLRLAPARLGLQPAELALCIRLRPEIFLLRLPLICKPAMAKL